MNSILGVIVVIITCLIIGLIVWREESLRYNNIFSERTSMTADEWHRFYYADSDVKLQSVITSIELLSRVLGVPATLLEPQENIAILFDEFDVSELNIRISRELGIPVPKTTNLCTINDIIILIDNFSRGDQLNAKRDLL